MDKQPHSRDKKVGTGSANVNKGDKVDTGSRPVGSGGRPGSTPSKPQSSSGSAQRTGGQRASGSATPDLSGVLRSLPIKLNLKTILILAVVVIVLVLVLKQCGGLGALFGGLGDAFELGDAGDFGEYVDNGAASSYSDYKDGQLDRSVDASARAKFVTPKKGGTVTIMVYMCGTDLESKYGMASSDLGEMASATLSDNVNVIVMTGGCSKWKTTSISNKANQIYRVVEGGISKLEDNFGTKAMTDPDNLVSFIDYCEKNYAADRNMLVFWDHGGGSVTGYGYDEKNPNSSSMTLNKIAAALKKADCKFDTIGFDACLMATLETALVCEPYADYLIASEETEPGTGWYYTRWLSELCADTSKPTLDIAKTLIDDFVTSSSQGSSSAKVTLSLVDLAELHGTVPEAFNGFSTSTTNLIKNDYEQVSNARAGVRQFAQSSKINQVDLIDLCDRIGSAEAKELAKVLEGSIKYNRSTISRSYGISIYFPYESTSSVSSAVASYNAIGLDAEYTKCIKSFASLELGGQVAGAASQTSGGSSSGDLLGSLLGSLAGGGSSTSPLDVLAGSFLSGSGSSATESAGNSLDPSALIGLLGAFSGRSMPAGLEWADTELIAENAEKIAAAYLDPSHITATEKNGKKVLSLTDAEWALVNTVELSVYAKDADGYLDLGLDNTFDMDGNDLLLEWDGTWMTLDGNACAYYLLLDEQEADGSWTTVGRVPAELNGQLVNLQVVFDAAHPDGAVTGAYPMYGDGETDAQAKGLIPIRAGDKIQLLCDYYKKNGSFDSAYTLGSEFTVGAKGVTIENLTLNNADGYSVMYRITDIYGNHYWTPEVN